MAEQGGQRKLNSEAHHYDAVIGVVGLAITKRLTEANQSVLLVEKEDSVGKGTSSR